MMLETLVFPSIRNANAQTPVKGDKEKLNWRVVGPLMPEWLSGFYALESFSHSFTDIIKPTYTSS